MHKKYSIKAMCFAALSLITLNLVFPVVAFAASATISRSYQENNPIPSGSIVSIASKDSSHVLSSNTTNGSRLIGVTVSKNQSLLAINSNNLQTQVATSGTVTALVSNLNGNVSQGDQVAISAIAGVGMKAQPGSYVIGLAEASFTSRSSHVTTQTIKQLNGRSKTVEIGYIPVSIDITTVPAGTDGNSQLGGLQQFAKSLTGNVISKTRIILALVIATITLSLVVALVYSSIYGSIISIGRNPLARMDIIKNLMRVLVMTSFLTIIALLIIFFLLH
jgi:hypothetical protein